MQGQSAAKGCANRRATGFGNQIAVPSLSGNGALGRRVGPDGGYACGLVPAHPQLLAAASIFKLCKGPAKLLGLTAHVL